MFHFYTPWKRQKPRGITAQKMKFSIRDFFSKYYQIHSFSSAIFIFAEEISHGKFQFLCGIYKWNMGLKCINIIAAPEDKLYL